MREDVKREECCVLRAACCVKASVGSASADRLLTSGSRAVEGKVHPHDRHATVLALMGFDHTKLTYRYNGRDFRLTDNFGNVVKDVIA